MIAKLTMGKDRAKLPPPIDERQKESELVREKLRPLLQGKSVAFRMKDRKRPLKPRIGPPLLFILPGAQFGDTQSLVFALQGGSCEVLRVDDLKPAALVKVGLTVYSARLLIEQLGQMLREEGPLTNDID